MSAGNMRHRLTFKSPTFTDNADGGFRETAVATSVERWAELVSASGREFDRAAQVFADVTHVWRIRHMPTLTAKWYAVDEHGDTYEIIDVHVDDNAETFDLVSSKRTVT